MLENIGSCRDDVSRIMRSIEKKTGWHLCIRPLSQEEQFEIHSVEETGRRASHVAFFRQILARYTPHDGIPREAARDSFLGYGENRDQAVMSTLSFYMRSEHNVEAATIEELVMKASVYGY